MNEASMLLKKQLPSVRKLLRRKTLEREVRVSAGPRRSTAGPWLATSWAFPSQRRVGQYTT